MAVIKTGVSTWKSTLMHNEFDSELAARRYDNEARIKISPQSEGSKVLDRLSAPELKSLINELNKQSEVTDGVRDFRRVQEQFILDNPEFIANPANGHTLAATLVAKGFLTPSGIFTGSVADLQETYVSLVEQGMMQIKQGAQPPKRVAEDDMYKMPLEDLRQFGKGWR